MKIFILVISLIFPFAGVIISGGLGTETSIEVFPADANCSAKIPPFPAPGKGSPMK